MHKSAANPAVQRRCNYPPSAVLLRRICPTMLRRETMNRAKAGQSQKRLGVRRQSEATPPLWEWREPRKASRVWYFIAHRKRCHRHRSPRPGGEPGGPPKMLQIMSWQRPDSGVETECSLKWMNVVHPSLQSNVREPGGNPGRLRHCNGYKFPQATDANREGGKRFEAEARIPVWLCSSGRGKCSRDF